MNKYSAQTKRLIPKSKPDLVSRAERLATTAHAGQLRRSGEPYISHPQAVAAILTGWGMDPETIAAAWLHDTVEDTGLPLETIETEFGPKVAELVDGVTKLGTIDMSADRKRSPARQEISNENIRKLLLAMSKDLRVILIKLADRLHNLRTLKYLDDEVRVRKAEESLAIYAPLADRLGMGQVKAEIEDLSFQYVDPAAYDQVLRLMADYSRRSSRYLDRLGRYVRAEVEAAGVGVESIEGRQKHLYSVAKKLAKADGEIEKIYDLMAMRLIVLTESDCYQALGILHQHFKPLIYRIKDYIAVPKPNGYRSLHTTVFALDGRIIEFQIRTPQMHDEAERGLAAHFYYDSLKQTKGYRRGQTTAVPKRLDWVNRLADLPGVAGPEFADTLKIDLFSDRIFVFSPKGDLYDLPEGSTPVDFAFAVHTNIGLRTQGAKVNGKIAPLDSKLENRDLVEILTRKSEAPNRDWLSFVKTAQARNRVRAWFRAASHSSNAELGKSLLEAEIKAWGANRLEEVDRAALDRLVDDLSYKTTDDLLAAVGEGVVGVSAVIRRLFPMPTVKPDLPKPVKPSAAKDKVIVAEDQHLLYHLAPCCAPAFPQPIVGYVTRGSGVTIHHRGCANLPADPERQLEARWQGSATSKSERMVCHLRIAAANQIGLLRDITAVVSGLGLNIHHLATSHPQADQSVVDLKLELPDVYLLTQVMKRLDQIPAITALRRVK